MAWIGPQMSPLAQRFLEFVHLVQTMRIAQIKCLRNDGSLFSSAGIKDSSDARLAVEKWQIDVDREIKKILKEAQGM